DHQDRAENDEQFSEVGHLKIIQKPCLMPFQTGRECGRIASSSCPLCPPPIVVVRPFRKEASHFYARKELFIVVFMSSQHSFFHFDNLSSVGGGRPLPGCSDLSQQQRAHRSRHSRDSSHTD